MQINTGSLPISDEETQPLPHAASLAFQSYLDHHALTIRDVAHAAHVRLLVVWNILHGNPVLPEDAGKVRSGLFLLTKERFYGPIPVRTNNAYVHQKGVSPFTQAFARV